MKNNEDKEEFEKKEPEVKKKVRRWELTSDAELGHKLFTHLVKYRMSQEEAWRRVATYYGVGCVGVH